MMKRLDSEKDETARGYVAIGLGLMDAREAMEKIQRIVDESKYRPDLLKQAAIALGLLGDKDLVPKLVALLEESKGLATQASLSSALGFIGDQRSIDPLVAMLQNDTLTERARGFAAVALGIVADKEPLPWNSKIGLDLNYRASTQTLTDQASGTGILDIL
jgi:HEAT repeat protein